jgi:hypothetical protein
VPAIVAIPAHLMKPVAALKEARRSFRVDAKKMDRLRSGLK